MTNQHLNNDKSDFREAFLRKKILFSSNDKIICSCEDQEDVIYFRKPDHARIETDLAIARMLHSLL